MVAAVSHGLNFTQSSKSHPGRVIVISGTRTASDADQTRVRDADGHPHQKPTVKPTVAPPATPTAPSTVGSAAYRHAPAAAPAAVCGNAASSPVPPPRRRARSRSRPGTTPACSATSCLPTPRTTSPPARTTWAAASTRRSTRVSNDTFTGAPGAIISGADPGSAGYRQNDFAFVGNDTGVTGVTIEYLTIENFSPPGSQGAVNTNSDDNWTIAHSTIKDNVPGAAMMVGSGNTIEHNCLTGNGQYAFNAYQNPGDPQRPR